MDNNLLSPPLHACRAYACDMKALSNSSSPPVLDNPSKKDARLTAKHLYWQGWRISCIAKHLEESRSTIQSWKQRDQWDRASPLEKIETSLEARLVQLIAKDSKTGGDFKEIDLLMRQVVQSARVRRYEAPGGNEVSLNPKLAHRNAQPKKKPVRNEFSEEQQTQLLTAFRDSLFDYQQNWYRNGTLSNEVQNCTSSHRNW